MDETPAAALDTGERPLEVGEFYEQVTGLLERAFPKSRPVTIRGEIAKIYEKSHLYLTLSTPVPRPRTPAAPSSTPTAGSPSGVD